MAGSGRSGPGAPLLERLSQTSLLWATPPSERIGLAAPVRTALQTDALLERICRNRRQHQIIEQLLATPASDEERAERVALWRDLRAHGELADLVRRLEERVAEIHTMAERERDRDLLKLVWRLGDLGLLVESVELLSAVLIPLKDRLASRRLRSLAETLADADGDATLQGLRRDLPRLQEGLRDRRSVTVGINLDDRLRPREAVLLSVNAGEFGPGGVLDRIGDALRGSGSAGNYRTRMTIHRNTDDPSGQVPLTPLFEDLDAMLGELSRPLAQALRRYNGVQLGWLRRLVEELGVIAALAGYADELEAAGMPVSGAGGEGGACEGSDAPADRVLAATELYDPLLVTAGSRPVSASVELFALHPTVVVTGPNNGGKTTLLRALGTAVLCDCAGLPVAAGRFQRGGIERLAVAFAGGEADGPGAGRFAHEARQVALMLGETDDRTLVLLNETFSSTAGADAADLLAELTAVLAARGSRTVLATHLHQVLDALAAESLTFRPGEPYVLHRDRPDGRSLAREVARDAGLDFDRFLP